ncbi:MAG: PAS domain-containing protein [Chloroflexi bacterium]|nr:PAS domain-containing protein [Chloroflexota bacterium]
MSKALRSLMSLRARLLWLVFLAVAPMLGLIFYLDLQQRERVVDEIEADALRTAHFAADAHQDLIENARALLTTLALLPQIQSDDSTACNDLLARVIQQNSAYANLAVADPNGAVLCSAIPFTGKFDIAERPHFRRALETREFAVGDYQVGLISHKASLALGYPILDLSGQVRRVVTAGLDLAWLNQVAASARLPEGSQLVILDRNGVILARYPNPENWVGKLAADYAIAKTVLAQNEGTAQGLGMDDVPLLYAFTTLHDQTDSSAHVLIGVPRAVAFAAQDAILTRQLVALALVTALVFVLAWYGGDWFIVRRVNTLLRATRRLAEGDLSARTTLPYGVSELSELARDFDEMADALEQRDARQTHIAQELEAERDFVLQIVNTMGQGLTVIDEEDRFVYVNPAYARMTGYSVQDLIGKCPSDVTVIEDLDTLALAQANRVEGKTTTYEMHVRRPDGAHVHALVTGVPRWHAGQYAGAIAVITDLTERRQMEEALRASESLYQSLVAALPLSLCRKDLDGRLVFANARYCEAFGKSLADLMGKTDWDLHPPELAEKYRADDLRVIESGDTFETVEEHQPLGGSKRFVQVLKTPLRDREGAIGGLQIVFWDVTARTLAEQQLEYLSTHDTLTQLFNRAFFESELTSLEHSRQFPVSLVMVDVDRLKPVNDQQGHAAGDALLQRAASVLRKSFRAEDVVARIGGDEFAVLLPNTDANAAEITLRRVRHHLKLHNAAENDAPLEFSIGVATATRGELLNEALRQADAQMYCEKEAHRKRDAGK